MTTEYVADINALRERLANPKNEEEIVLIDSHSFISNGSETVDVNAGGVLPPGWEIVGPYTDED